MNEWDKKGWAVTKFQNTGKMKVHELGDAPERKPASVDANLAETSILPGSPTGCINLPPQAALLLQVTNSECFQQHEQNDP